MKRHNISDFDLPLSAFVNTKIHSSTETFGFFIPQLSGASPMIVVGDGRRLSVFPLAGASAFKHNYLQVGNSYDGLLFEKIRFAVNVKSLTNPRADGRLGDLLVEEGQAHFLAIDAHSVWRDVESYPLPIEVETSSQRSIAFREWSVLLDHAGYEIELWRNDEASRGPNTKPDS